MPPLRRGLLSFGLVSFRFSSAPPPKTNTSPFICCMQNAAPACRTANTARNMTIEREDRVRGYEFAKNVRFTEPELESLETESSNNIEVKEFIPLSKIDPVYFDSAYYVGAGEGGEKPYRLLAGALANSKRAAIAQLVTRGTEQLVLIRPYENGLIMHSLYYANEVRNFADIAKGENTKLSDEEIELGADFIENMSDEFKPEQYRDEYRERVHAMLEE